MGKIKGNNFERYLCKTLSFWWSGGKREDIFWRTSNSGGRATTREKDGKKADLHCGDICAIDPIGNEFLKATTIEAKCGYNAISLFDVIDKANDDPTRKIKGFEEWIVQAERDRVRSGALYWTIIHKRDRRVPIVVTWADFIYRICDIDDLIINKNGRNRATIELMVDGVHYELEVMSLDTFLSIDPTSIKGVLESSNTSIEPDLDPTDELFL